MEYSVSVLRVYLYICIIYPPLLQRGYLYVIVPDKRTESGSGTAYKVRYRYSSTCKVLDYVPVPLGMLLAFFLRSPAAPSLLISWKGRLICSTCRLKLHRKVRYR